MTHLKSSLKSSLKNNCKAWLKQAGLLSAIAILLCHMTSQHTFATSPHSSASTLKQMSDQPSTQTDQGSLNGKVTQLSGDHMPGSAPNSSARYEQVSIALWIFTGKIANPGSPYWPLSEAQQHPSFLRQTTSNEEGHYSVTLPPGEYTVFMQSGDALYLNAFQRDGSYQSVEVLPNQATTFNLMNTAEATF